MALNFQVTMAWVYLLEKNMNEKNINSKRNFDKTIGGIFLR